MSMYRASRPVMAGAIATVLSGGIAGVTQAQTSPVVLDVVEDTRASQVSIPIGGAPFLVERAGRRQIDIVSPGSSWKIDFAQLARKPQGGRVAGAREVLDDGGMRLRLLLNCDCDFAALVNNGILTVEVRDPAPGASGDAEAPEPARNSAPARAPAPRESIDLREVATRLERANGSRLAPLRAPQPVPRGGGTQRDESGLSATQDKTNDAPASPGGDPKTAEEREKEIRLARESLLMQLSRAADQGLLDFTSEEAAAKAPPPPDDDSVRAELSAEEEPESEAAPQPAPAPAEPDVEEPEVALRPETLSPVEVPVRARTAIDKVFRTDRRDTIVRRAPCIEDYRLDLRGWEGRAGFLEDLSAFNRTLVDPFDNANEASATGLARLYIAWGFGAEAEQIAALYGDAVEDTALLADLAAIVEGRQPASDGPLATSGPCSGPAALWSEAGGLSNGAPDSEPQIREAMMDALMRLPLQTRAIIGPLLMNRRLDTGDITGAEAVDALLARSPTEFGPSLDLARARLLAANGDTKVAEQLFGRLARQALPESKDALLLLLDSRIKRNAPVSDDLTNALSEAAFLERGGVMERALTIAEIRAVALSRGLPDALSRIAEVMRRRPADIAILQDAGHAAIEQVGPEEGEAFAYAEAILDYSARISTESAGDAARARAAQELTTLGLANAALDMLSPALERGQPAVRLAAARAYLAADQPSDALVQIEGLDGPDAMKVRIDALERLDRMDDALAVARAMTDEPVSEMSARALRAGDWARAAETESEPRRLLAAYMATQSGAPLSGDPVPDENVTTDGNSAPAEILPSTDRTPEAMDFLNPPQLGDEVTLQSVSDIMNASEAARRIIEEALKDG